MVHILTPSTTPWGDFAVAGARDRWRGSILPLESLGLIATSGLDAPLFMEVGCVPVEALLGPLDARSAELRLGEASFDAASTRYGVLQVGGLAPSVHPRAAALGAVLCPPQSAHRRVEVALPELQPLRRTTCAHWFGVLGVPVRKGHCP